jgi:hypothetical protein
MRTRDSRKKKREAKKVRTDPEMRTFDFEANLSPYERALKGF